MDSRAVTREIRDRVWKPLARLGFDKRTSRSAWRERGEHVEVVNFQSFNSHLAEGLGSTTFSFAVNLGIFPLYIPPLHPVKIKDGRALPDEYVCPIRSKLQKRIEQVDLPRKDIWLVEPDGANLTAVVDDAAAVVHDDGLPWFDSLSTPEAVSALLDGVEGAIEGGTWGFGNNGSPKRVYLQACTRMRLGTFTGDPQTWLREYAEYQTAISQWLGSSGKDTPRPPALPS